jgi:hypothetical protein
MTEVRIVKQTNWGDVKNPRKLYQVDEVYEVPNEVAERWIARRIAEPFEATKEIEPQVETTSSKVPGLDSLVRRR